MSEPRRDGPPGPFVMDAEPDTRGAKVATREPSPQIIDTLQTGRIKASELTVAAVPPPPEPARTRGRDIALSLGLFGTATFFVGWLAISAVDWVIAVHARSETLGLLAGLVTAAGVIGIGALVAREMRSFFKLRNIEKLQQHLDTESVTLDPIRTRHLIAEVITIIPSTRETTRAIETFQRQVQPQHAPAQQIELLAHTVMTPLDRRAEAIVRKASLQAVGLTAISPRAFLDALLFAGVGLRMMRAVAACYGHRPTTAATFHLLRRVVGEAGRLAAIDLAAVSLTQHLGGAVAERFATSAAESLYAAQRMARLGLVTMALCRPVPFKPGEAPKLTSLLANVMRRRDDAPDEPA